ncbi:MAG: replication initiation protein, partial [Methylovulum sp.]
MTVIITKSEPKETPSPPQQKTGGITNAFKLDLDTTAAFAAHRAFSLAHGKTADSLQSRRADAVEKNNQHSLVRLYDALTKHKSSSYYAAWSQIEVERALEMLEAAFARLGKKSPGAHKATRKREKKPIEPLALAAIEHTDLFADINRWPKRPYCSNDVQKEGLKIRSLQQALSYKSISPNPPNLRVWSMFDIDRSDAAKAWEQAALPEPTWTAVDKESGYAHLVWGLTVPVRVDGLGARDAPMRFLASIELFMREKLGADTGYTKLITKNPAHPEWQILRGPRMTYSLQELAEHLPGIEKYRPKKSAEKIGLGRNVSLFDELRKWSYKSIRKYWGGGLGDWNAWLSACNSQGLVMNADFFGMNP